MLAYCGLSLASNLIDIARTGTVDETLVHHFIYFIFSLIAIVIIIECQKVEDCFHCFNRVQYNQYSALAGKLRTQLQAEYKDANVVQIDPFT